MLVAEFSELEGYVAAEYARREGVSDEVATAVEEHYLPEGPDSPMPSSEVGALVAAAEKIDNLVGAFAVDEAPTGSKDPYGLRRAATGLVRIALDRGWDVSPMDALRSAATSGSARRAPTWRSTPTPPANWSCRSSSSVSATSWPARASARRPSRPRGASSTARRRSPRGRGTSRRRAARRSGTRRGRRPPACSASRARGRPRMSRSPPGDDPGEAALRDAIAGARPGIDAALDARDLPAALRAAGPLAGAVDPSSRTCWSTPTTPGSGRGGTGWYARRRPLLSRIADFERVTEGGGAR